MGMMYLHNQ